MKVDTVKAISEISRKPAMNRTHVVVGESNARGGYWSSAMGDKASKQLSNTENMYHCLMI